MRLNIQHGLQSVLNAVVELIITIEDYAVIKHITLSEGAMFAFYLFRALWFVAFGVENANYSYMAPEIVWTIIHLSLSFVHLIGFFFKKPKLRIIALFGYASVLCTLIGLAAYSRTSSPAIPSLVPLASLSIFLIVRLSSDSKNDLQNNE